MEFTNWDRGELENVVGILGEAGFFEALTSHNAFYDWADSCHDFGNYTIDFFTGATKVVAVIDGIDWVLKVDFVGNYLLYCGAEASNYEWAVKEGWGKYFAAEFLLGEFYGTEVYVQELTFPDEDAVSDSCYEFYTKDMNEEESEEWWDSVGPDGLDDVERVAAMFPELKGSDLGKFWQFLDRFHINDLHIGNFGWRSSDNTPVIFDYSGYQG